jgi:hypothetical protein
VLTQTLPARARNPAAAAGADRQLGLQQLITALLLAKFHYFSAHIIGAPVN